MRNILTLSAASVLTLGICTHFAIALPPGAKAVSPDGLVYKVQKSGEPAGSGQTPGAGPSGSSQTPGAAKGTERGSGAAGAKDGGTAVKQGEGGDRKSGMRSDQGDPGARSDQKGARGDGARSQQRRNVDVDVRGGRGDRTDRRTRVDIDVERRRRSGRDVDVNIGRGYGYAPAGCQEILRRYRQCVAR